MRGDVGTGGDEPVTMIRRGHATPLIQPHLLRMAEAYPDEARFTPDKVRERLFTVDQQVAWALRFGEGARP